MYPVRVSVLLLLCVSLFSCKSGSLSSTEIKNYAYGTDTQQVADIFLPKEHSIVHTPVVVLIHGGGWNAGDKTDFYYAGVEKLCLEHGYAVVNMNYRLAAPGKNTYPAQLDDMDLVMKMITEKSADWAISDKAVCLLGRSAGAHIALQYAYTRNTRNNIKAVIDFFGPADLADTAYDVLSLGSDIAMLLGVAKSSNAARWKTASPVNHMDGAIPTFIAHGTADTTVPPGQSIRLKQLLNERHIPAVLDTLPGRMHYFPKEDWTHEVNRALQWVQQYMRP